MRMATLVIQDRTASGTPIRTIDVPDLPDRFTLRDLIRTRVRDEVARHNLKPAMTFAGLVQPEGATQTANGYRMPKLVRIDWERQAAAALTAFERNGFFVLVNGRQVTELDEVIVLQGTMDVGFIKLTPLIGG
jgi:hypothetical protein